MAGKTPQILGFPLYSVFLTQGQKKAQNPQPALDNRCLSVAWLPCCCLLPPVLSIPAAREDAKHSGSQKVVLPCCCWLKNHLALYMPPPKLNLATMKLEPKSSRWHCSGVSRNYISITVYCFFRKGHFLNSVCKTVTDLGNGLKSR